LAMASTSGPLYMTFCERRPGSPANDPFVGCGVIGEINPATWTVTSKRWYGGPVSYGRYGIVATQAGAWLSAGGGGNGVDIEFYSSAGLRPAQSSWSSSALATSTGKTTVERDTPPPRTDGRGRVRPRSSSHWLQLPPSLPPVMPAGRGG
jgi:hypothetical protein